MRFDGRRILVTGGTRGIGLGVAEFFSQRGGSVAICSKLPPNAEVAREFPWTSCDIGDPDACRSAIHFAADTLGGLDILINNAASFQRTRVVDAGAALLLDMFRTNVFGAMYMCQEFMRMEHDAGTERAIVSIGSISEFRAAPNYGVYGATKSALSALMRSLAIECADQNVRVNVVAPGHVNTEEVVSDIASGQILAGGPSRWIPMGAVATIDQVASLVAFLAHHTSSHVTGQTISIDGGQSLRV